MTLQVTSHAVDHVPKRRGSTVLKTMRPGAWPLAVFLSLVPVAVFMYMEPDFPVAGCSRPAHLRGIYRKVLYFNSKLFSCPMYQLTILELRTSRVTPQLSRMIALPTVMDPVMTLRHMILVGLCCDFTTLDYMLPVEKNAVQFSIYLDLSMIELYVLDTCR